MRILLLRRICLRARTLPPRSIGCGATKTLLYSPLLSARQHTGPADHVGDSLDLSRRAAETKADVIVFCGVRFMAEVAKILSPERKVLLPDAEAVAHWRNPVSLRIFANSESRTPITLRLRISTAQRKLRRCPTSSSRHRTRSQSFRQFPERQPILFAPDRNLGGYINRKTHRNMTLWPGSCVCPRGILRIGPRTTERRKPEALVVAHPEMPGEYSEFCGPHRSTRSLLDFATKTSADTIIVVTESNLIHQMMKAAPQKKFIAVPVRREAAPATLRALSFHGHEHHGKALPVPHQRSAPCRDARMAYAGSAETAGAHVGMSQPKTRTGTAECAETAERKKFQTTLHESSGWISRPMQIANERGPND